MYSRLLALFVFLFFLSHLSAQDKYTFQVTIQHNTKSPIQGAQVVLKQNNKIVKGTKSQQDGQAYISEVNAGEYELVISYLGLKSDKRTVNITQNLNLGVVVLMPQSQNLEEIVISANKTSKASNIDKKVYAPSQLMSAQNASAAELLNALPSMSTGSDGNNLSFRGDENVAIMINGKMTSYTADNLSQIPANNIERIEVIAVPNSKYNSEGSAGVINIVLKNAKAGLNSGFILGSMGNNNKYNAQLGYNFSKDKLALSAAFNQTYNEFESDGFSRRLYKQNPLLYRYKHESIGERIKRMQNFRLGADYELTKNAQLSFLGSFSLDHGSGYSSDNDTFFAQSGLMHQQWRLESADRDLNTLYDLNVSYKLIAPQSKNEWTIEVSRSDNMNDKSQQYDRRFAIDNGKVVSNSTKYRVDNLQRRPITAVQTDYIMNLPHSTTFESGLRAANRDFTFTNDYVDYTNAGEVLNPIWTNNFNYQENVFSLYGLITKTWTEKLTTKVGLRAEQTNTHSYNQDTSLHQYDYFLALPSAMIKYQLGKKLGSLTASYSLRVNRPGPGMLNPLQDVADPISKRLGEPTLKPELVSSGELAHGLDLGSKVSMSNSIYHKRSENTITRFQEPQSDGTFRVTIDNIGLLQITGWEAIASLRFSKKSSVNLSSNLSHNSLEYTAKNGQFYTQNFLNWQGRAILNQSLFWGLEGQLIAFYKAPFNSPQGQILFNSNVDVSIRKKVAGGKGLFILSCFDLLNDTKFNLEASDTNFENMFWRKRETRYVTLAFRYNFGSESTKKPKIEKPEPREGGGDMGM